jgi:predicted Ser/Thr protein kinase
MIVNSRAEPAPTPKAEGSLVGSTLGKYALTAEVGRGSMGVVYDAQDTTLHRRVAVKVMHAPRGDAQEAVGEWQRFMQEARLTANVAKHPNIVTVYEAAVHDARRYIAMEYVAGEPMGRWRKGRSLREQVRLLRDVALALHHAHDHGIIHRDLKPANVLVAKGGVPVVTDFGLARSEQRGAGPSITPSGFVVGSPAYMSPEQARGQKNVDRTTDVYAIGVMLYEAIAGRPPFDGKNPVETLSKVVEGTRVPPSQAAPLPDGDPVLDQVCMKAMALEASERYPTCADLAQALTQWLDVPAVRGARRPRIGLIAAAAALALAAVGSLFWIQHRSLQRAAEREEEIRAQVRATMQKIEEKKAAPVHLKPEDFKLADGQPFNEVTPGRIRFLANARFEAPVRILDDGVYVFTVTASCDVARNEFAKFDFTADGVLQATVKLTDENPKEYEVTARLKAGEQRIGIAFLNDFYVASPFEDRNLYVHLVSYRKSK